MSADGVADLLDAEVSLPLGVAGVFAQTGRAPRPLQTGTIAPGETLVLYSDGLVEGRNWSLSEGLNRLCVAASEAHAARLPVSGLPHRLVQVLRRADLDDDVTVLVARRQPDHVTGPS